MPQRGTRSSTADVPLVEREEPLRPGGHVRLVVLFAVYLVLLAWTVVWKLDVPYVGAAALLPAPDQADPVRGECRGRCQRTARDRREHRALRPVRPLPRASGADVAVVEGAGVFVGASLVLEITQHLLSTGSFDTTRRHRQHRRRPGRVRSAGPGAPQTPGTDSHGHDQVCLIGTVVSLLAIGIFVVSPLHDGPQHDVIFATPAPSSVGRSRSRTSA